MKITKEREKELLDELRALDPAHYSLTDKSEENLRRGGRIREIREELGLISKPRKTRRPCRYIPK